MQTHTKNILLEFVKPVNFIKKKNCFPSSQGQLIFSFNKQLFAVADAV